MQYTLIQIYIFKIIRKGEKIWLLPEMFPGISDSSDSTIVSINSGPNKFEPNFIQDNVRVIFLLK